RMRSSEDSSESNLAQRVLMSSLGVFVVTSIHHAYGAYIYNTPWRLHAVAASAVTVILMAGLLKVFRSSPGTLLGKSAGICFLALGIIVIFLGFGIFEGGYNHVVKDVLYFSISPELTRRLYPPYVYELPNDFLFEVTGILQIVPGVATGYYLFLLARDIWH